MAVIPNFNAWELTGIIGFGGIVAGFVGALTGLGGGVIVVPLLTVGLGVDLRYAIGASLVSVIATSSGAAAAYVREGFTNLRIAMFLEVATASSAVIGAMLVARLPVHVISMIFGAVLLTSAYLTVRTRRESRVSSPAVERRDRLQLRGTYPTPAGLVPYAAHNAWGGFAIMLLAGALSGLLGIGSGALKVVAMDQTMKLPFKVSTTTSNFMIGVTAAAGAGVYLREGYIDPGLAMPVMLGVSAGALAGAHVLVGARPKWLRRLFAVGISLLAIEMIARGIARQG